MALFPALRLVSWLVLLLLLVSGGYTLAIVVLHWSGIGV